MGKKEKTISLRGILYPASKTIARQKQKYKMILQSFLLPY